MTYMRKTNDENVEGFLHLLTTNVHTDVQKIFAFMQL